MMQHTRDRREVSSNNIEVLRGIDQALFISILDLFFSPVPQRPLPQMSMVVGSGGLVCVLLGAVQVHVEVVKIKNTLHRTLPDRDTSNEQQVTTSYTSLMVVEFEIFSICILNLNYNYKRNIAGKR